MARPELPTPYSYNHASHMPYSNLLSINPPAFQRPLQHSRERRSTTARTVPDRMLQADKLSIAGQDDDAIYSTPYLQRISSERLPHDQRRMFVKGLVPLRLQQELATNISQTRSLANDVFPDDHLPFPIKDETLHYLAKEDIWDEDKAQFLKKPASFSESDVTQWLNILGRAIGIPHQQKRCRIWSSASCDLPPSGSTSIRQPDIALIDRGAYEDPKFTRVQWSTIHAFAEVSAQDSFPQRMFSTINEKSHIFFLTQDNRRFVPALSFDGSGSPLPLPIVKIKIEWL